MVTTAMIVKIPVPMSPWITPARPITREISLVCESISPASRDERAAIPALSATTATSGGVTTITSAASTPARHSSATSGTPTRAPRAVKKRAVKKSATGESSDRTTPFTGKRASATPARNAPTTTGTPRSEAPPRNAKRTVSPASSTSSVSPSTDITRGATQRRTARHAAPSRAMAPRPSSAAPAPAPSRVTKGIDSSTSRSCTSSAPSTTRPKGSNICWRRLRRRTPTRVELAVRARARYAASRVENPRRDETAKPAPASTTYWTTPTRTAARRWAPSRRGSSSSPATKSTKATPRTRASSTTPDGGGTTTDRASPATSRKGIGGSPSHRAAA